MLALRIAGLITAVAAAALVGACSAGGGALLEPGRAAQVSGTTAGPTQAPPLTVTTPPVSAVPATVPPPRPGEPAPSRVSTETVAATVTALVLSDDSGRVAVTGTDTGQVVITRAVYAYRAEPTEQVSRAGGELRITAPYCQADEWQTPCRIDYQVQVPRGLPVRVVSASGEVATAGLTGRQTATATSGDVSVLAAGGPVEARSTSGDVEVEAGAVLDSLTAAATSGNVHVTVPSGVYRVQAATVSGERNIAVGDSPGARALVRLSSVSGNVHLESR